MHLMDWCKLGSGYYRDRAILRAGEAAEILFTRALAYCAEHETDGHVPVEVLPLLVTSDIDGRVRGLVQERLWLEEADGYLVRSWESWQKDLDVAAERKRKDRERKKAARQRARDAQSTGTSEDTSADSPPDTSADVRAAEKSREEKKEPPTPSQARGRRTAKTPCPDIFPISDSMRKFVSDRNIPGDVARIELQRFLDHHRSLDSRFSDWEAAWRKWMGKVDLDLARSQRSSADEPEVRGVGGILLDSSML